MLEEVRKRDYIECPLIGGVRPAIETLDAWQRQDCFPPGVHQLVSRELPGRAQLMKALQQIAVRAPDIEQPSFLGQTHDIKEIPQHNPRSWSAPLARIEDHRLRALALMIDVILGVNLLGARL